MQITFILTPDKFSAHHLRKQLCSRKPLLGIQVGTWPELLELARTNYCVAQPDDDWLETVTTAMERMTKAFWKKSMDYDPEATIGMVSDTLSHLLWSLGPNQHPDPEPLSRRGREHLTDLLRLHAKTGNKYPAALSLIHSLLKIKAKHAIREIRVLVVKEMPLLNPWQDSLIDMLNKHAKDTEPSEIALSDFSGLLSWPAPKKGNSGLRHLQLFLFADTCKQHAGRTGLQWIAVRDYRQEIEIVVGMVQNLIDNHKVLPENIALLLPESQNYIQAAREIFKKAGIPLSGLENIAANRDLGRELIYNFLLCRQKDTPPPMLRASLFASPLLPWHETGVQVAQEFMNGTWFSDILQLIPEDQQKTARFLYGKQATTPQKLKKSLRGLTAILARNETWPEYCQSAMGIISGLHEIIDDAPDAINWSSLLQLCRPKTQAANENEGFCREGIRVFHPKKEPWQQVHHLLVLGFSEGRYPQLPDTSPVIPEEDRYLMEEQGIRLPTRKRLLREQRNLFLRQVRAAGESITFFIPQMDGKGNRLSPSSSLNFMALLFKGIAIGEKLLLDPEKKKDRKRIHHLALATKNSPVPPRIPEACDLDLGENLLIKRKDENGKTKPESPSGMSTMMVSPLAWVFNRFSIDSHEWAPQTLDALVAGSIAHEIFENLFTHTGRLPSRGRIPGRIQTLFKSVVKSNFPFLLEDEWQVERRQMTREFSEAAQAWWDFLQKNKLEILAEEVWLGGRFNHLPIRGKADLICRSTDGTLFVVDYKTSTSGARRELMGKGFDHQASLYCRMLLSGTPPEKYPVKLKNQLKKSPHAHALYYTLRDQTVLGDHGTNFLDGCEPAEIDIAHEGLQLIKRRMKQLRSGQVELNTVDDWDRYPDETGITPYALDDSPLISLFMKEGEE